MNSLLCTVFLLLTASQIPAQTTPAPPTFTTQTADRFANLALACVHKEYPNKLSHTLNSDADVAPPRQLTPAFYGCYDWHSSVHGHWLLVRLLKTFPTAAFAPQAREALRQSLTADNLAKEATYLREPGRASFERPYGVAMAAQPSRSMFIPENLEWKASPVTEGLQVAEDAEIFIFNSDRTYAHVSGVLHKDMRTGTISLCSGCGFSSEKGAWSSSSGSQMHVRFHLTHSDMKTSRKRVWTREEWALVESSSPLKAKGIRTPKESLVPFTSLANPQVLTGMLRDDN